MRSSILIFICCCLIGLRAEALVAFVNESDEFIILDLEKRQIIDRYTNESLVSYYIAACLRPYTHTFDMQDWRVLSPYTSGDYIKKATWGDTEYLVYSDKILAINGDMVQNWTSNIPPSPATEYNDILLLRDSIAVYTDSSCTIASLCPPIDTSISRSSGGVQHILALEPFFFMRVYTDKLSISSIYFPLLEYFVSHDFTESIVDIVPMDLMYLLTDRHLYVINPIYRKITKLLSSKSGIYFLKIVEYDKSLYILTSDHQVLKFDLNTLKVSAITYFESLPQSMGVDEGYVYIASGSEIYCLKPHNLEVNHVVKLKKDVIRTPVMKVYSY